MINTLSTTIAMAARKAALAGLLGAAATVAMIGCAGAAHAGTDSTPRTHHHGLWMYGDPAAAAPYWRRQTAGDCAEMAVADVVGQVTGQEPSEQKIEALAGKTPSVVHSGPIYDPKTGTKEEDVPVLLERYGIKSVAGRSSIGALEEALAKGHKIIVAVNWNPSDDHAEANHAVVVTGIDAKAGVVHLNDSGNNSGRDEKVSFARFDKAWATSQKWADITR